MEPTPTQENRIDLRFPMQAQITVFDYKTNEFFTAQTLNISAHGLCVFLPISLTRGEYVDVFFNLSTSVQNIIKKVRVIWTTPASAAPFPTGLHIDGEKINPVSLVLATLSTKYQNS